MSCSRIFGAGIRIKRQSSRKLCPPQGVGRPEAPIFQALVDRSQVRGPSRGGPADWEARLDNALARGDNAPNMMVLELTLATLLLT